MNGFFFDIGGVGKGRLSIGPRPRFESLQEWADTAKRRGVNTVVSLITEDEADRFGLDGEGNCLAQRDIDFLHFPVDDFDVPDDVRFSNLLEDLVKRLDKGQTIHAHCAGGIGRAGTLSSCILVASGMSAADAIATVSQARGCDVPETDEQVAFIVQQERLRD